MSMGISTMRSLISTNISATQLQNTNQLKTKTENHSRILKSEITTDKERGLNTQKKEDELNNMKSSIESMSLQMDNKVNNINEEINKIPEKEKEETNKIPEKEKDQINKIPEKEKDQINKEKENTKKLENKNNNNIITSNNIDVTISNDTLYVETKNIESNSIDVSV